MQDSEADEDRKTEDLKTEILCTLVGTELKVV
jgi:hypothetical protein